MSNRFSVSTRIVTGTGIVADTAPNSAEPAATRAKCVSPRPVPGCIGKAMLFIVDGTSLIVTLWYKDPTLATWVQLAASVTLLPGVAQYIQCPFGADVFAQMVTNTGTVTKFGMGFI